MLYHPLTLTAVNRSSTLQSLAFLPSVGNKYRKANNKNSYSQSTANPLTAANQSDEGETEVAVFTFSTGIEPVKRKKDFISNSLSEQNSVTSVRAERQTEVP